MKYVELCMSHSFHKQTLFDRRYLMSMKCEFSTVALKVERKRVCVGTV